MGPHETSSMMSSSSGMSLMAKILHKWGSNVWTRFSRRWVPSLPARLWRKAYLISPWHVSRKYWDTVIVNILQISKAWCKAKRFWQQTQQGLLASAAHQGVAWPSCPTKVHRLLRNLTHIKCLLLLILYWVHFSPKDISLERDYSKWQNGWFWHFQSRDIYSFCVLWGEKREKAPVITVHISWVFLRVLIRGNCLDIYFLLSNYGLRASYEPGTARCKWWHKNINSFSTG